MADMQKQILTYVDKDPHYAISGISSSPVLITFGPELNLFFKRMMNFSKRILIFSCVSILASCTTMNRSMKEPNSRVDFTKADFTFSKQVSGTASSTKIIGIDWSRIFMAKGGNIEGALNISLASIPVIGTVLTDKTANYALYELMEANPGYDVVFYPQYETTVTKPIIIGFLFKKTTVKATARLAKLKE